MSGRRPETVSLTQIAAVFGVTTETIRLWRKKGMPSRRQSGQPVFDLPLCVRWRREQDRAKVPDDGEDSSKEDRRAILRADRRLREIEVAEREGLLVAREDFVQEVEAFVGGFVAAVSGRLQQFEREMVQCTTPAQARTLSQRIQDEVLRAARQYAERLEESADAEDEGDGEDAAA